MAALDGPAGLQKRCVVFILSATRVSFCFVVVLAELRTELLQRRLLFEGNFAGLRSDAGACTCPSKDTDLSCLNCCLCFALVRSVLLLVAGLTNGRYQCH